MRIKVSQLIPGCILQEDVFGKTGQPIVPERTVLTEEHIQFLEKFLVKEVQVFNELEDGSLFQERKKMVERSQSSREKSSLLSLYNELAQAYQEQFEQWKTQQRVDVAIVRQKVLPLFDQLMQEDLSQLAKKINDIQGDPFILQQTLSCLISLWIGQTLNYEKGELYQLGLASLLRDSGFIKIPDAHHLLATQLYVSDRSEISEHPIFSYRLVENSPLLNQAAKLSILQHEERNDRSGYPLKLQGKDIHRYAKIIGASDLLVKALNYFSKTSQAFIKDTKEFLQNNQSGKLDPEFTKLLIHQLLKGD